MSSAELADGTKFYTSSGTAVGGEPGATAANPVVVAAAAAGGGIQGEVVAVVQQPPSDAAVAYNHQQQPVTNTVVMVGVPAVAPTVIQEKYFGCLSCLICWVFFPLGLGACCCPCDTRTVVVGGGATIVAA
ncbi:hypothetical protein CTAYLR_002844 [Chrysophaeum taylorii]|uniref:Uncharacterized protein n=1 Tax=Chrysophaeum taylorii TaxID=2483200 RepID=A0AAD7U8A6_9STRA|nr:hypothetical protein CTAYLR_002844 [Chrysophaeum taylorii]